jgi:hypothetical protein
LRTVGFEPWPSSNPKFKKIENEIKWNTHLPPSTLHNMIYKREVYREPCPHVIPCNFAFIHQVWVRDPFMVSLKACQMDLKHDMLHMNGPF